ncbi:MAG: hypothetical protein AAFP76_08835 [Bacteroidota bacterium]
MKTKIFPLATLLLALFMCISCSRDEVSPQVEDANLIVQTTTEAGDGEGRSFGGFSFCGQWIPPVAPMGTSGTILQITYSSNPNDYPNGVVDIECTRKEYFDRFCALRMTQLQNQDPYKDTWNLLDDPQSIDPACAPRPKDDVDVASQSDPRVCVGSDCD